MVISSSNVALSSTHLYSRSVSRKESLNAWVGENPPTAEPQTGIVRPSQPNSARALPRAAQESAVNRARAAEEQTEEEALDASTLILKRLIEKMFGGRFRLCSSLRQTSNSDCSGNPSSQAASSPPASSRQGWGVEYSLDEVSQENEQLQFAARGQVQTDDGRTIAFDLAFQIQRSSVEEQHFEFKAGDALIDPLVLNFDGAAVQLAEGTFAFDLQADGKTESLPLPGTGSFFLAIDRNQDGKVNDGSELFGPTTGDGFSELAQYDADQNGWIDEGDAVYRDLRLWQPNAEDSGQLTTLTDKVGAIYLQSASTPFTYQDTAGQTEATTSESGVFLQEDGTPGTIQELNYVV